MFEELLAAQNPHWTGERYDPGVARTCFTRLLEYTTTGQVVAITGVRRAGKSTLIKQYINHLIDEQGVSARSILFVNLEHPYLSPYREDSANLQRLYEDYLKMMQPKGIVYVCLDEVQFFADWPLFVKAHHETKKVRFVVTGSNAAMLSSDMVTMLSGRSLPLEVFPCSFREVARSRGLNIDDPVTVAQQAPALKRLLEDVLEYGGFPTVVFGSKNQTASDILGEHARTVLLQDVAPRLGVRKPADLEKLYVYLVSNIGKLFSYSKLSDLFGLSDKSIKEYIQALAEAHLVYEVDSFSFSLRQQIRSSKKIYAIDTGQAHAMGFNFSANHGRMLENLIFIDLKRLGLEVYYYKTEANREVDFVVKSGSSLSLVQVTWDINEPDTRERELRALREAMKELKCDKGVVIVAESIFPSDFIEAGVTVLAAHQYLSLAPIERKHQLFT